ncbi:MAG: F0F1 ATP synthase subunit gamma [Betaproteobacteria bacterium]|nr:F0F1 ATP synthase subunit gamma [Betaproteobacteria bacterium]
MSKRARIQRHLAMLEDISDIMGAMRNLSLMETHKLARFLAHQHRVLAGIETAAADFLSHYARTGYRPAPGSAGLLVAIGSQRGFCGDFNKQVADAVHRHWQQTDGSPAGVVVVGRRLAAKLGADPRIRASLDAPSVAEEVQPMLQRLTTTLGELQAQADRALPLAAMVCAHREAEREPGVRTILPAPGPLRASPRHSFPPLLNVAPPQFFAGLAHHYLWARMHDVFYGSLMAENRRRLQHMEGAMRRIEEKSGALRRRYNLLRQEEITEEIEVIMLSNDALATRSQ